MDNDKYKLIFQMPGAFAYFSKTPEGIPNTDLLWNRRLNILEEQSSNSEIKELIRSLSTNCKRTTYHYERYKSILDEVRSRKGDLPGEIIWDSLNDCIHFELQAMFGSIRTIIDEIIYLIGRLNNLSHRKLKNIKGWDPYKIFENIETEKRKGIPEFSCFPKYEDWFHIINSYRNAFYHHGWLHGESSEYVGLNKKLFKLSRNNAFLLPDWQSIKSNTKPIDWTWKKAYQLDDIAEESYSKFLSFIDELCTKYWKIEIPEKGKLESAENPNIFVRTIQPLLFKTDKIIFPIYTSIKKALSINKQLNPDKHDLAEINCYQKKYFTVSLKGFEMENKINIMINPKFQNNNFISRNHVKIDLKSMKVNHEIGHYPIYLTNEYEKIYLWRDIESVI